MRALALAASLIALPAGAAAQWLVGVELATSRYGGSSRDTSNGTGPPSFRPGDATLLRLRVEKRFGSVGVAVRATKGKTGLTGTGHDVTITDKSVGDLLEGAALATIRVRGIGPSGAVRAEVGPALHLWTKAPEDTDARLGALGALAYEWTVAGHLSGAIRIEGMISKSWFDPGDLPPEYELRRTWRYGVTLGLSYRL